MSGGFRLTQDVTCDFKWPGANDVLDLNHHTLTSWFLPSGTGKTIKNGTVLATDTEYLFEARNFTISRVTIKPAPGATLAGAFMVEAGDFLTVTHSVLTGAPIDLDFYYGNYGTVEDSTFSGATYDGLSIQLSSSITIEHNTFSGNAIGVNLWTEELAGVDDNTIQHNTFTDNALGVRLDLLDNPTHPTGSDNVFSHNTFTGSTGSGIYAMATCDTEGGSNICPEGNVITANTFRKNGATPSSTTPFADDGVTARGFLWVDGQKAPKPSSLVGLTLAGNTADRNADLGFDVAGVTDGGGNQAHHNGNPAQCDGLSCQVPAQAGEKPFSNPASALAAPVPPELHH